MTSWIGFENLPMVVSVARAMQAAFVRPFTAHMRSAALSNAFHTNSVRFRIRQTVATALCAAPNRLLLSRFATQSSPGAWSRVSRSDSSGSTGSNRRQQSWRDAKNSDDDQERVPILVPTLFTIGFIGVSFAGLSYLESLRQWQAHLEQQAALNRPLAERLLGRLFGRPGLFDDDDDELIEDRFLTPEERRIRQLQRQRRLRASAAADGNGGVAFSDPPLLDRIMPEFVANVRDMVRDAYNEMNPAQRTTLGIIAVNIVVFGMWQVPALSPFMSRHFLRKARSPPVRAAYTLLTSAFSHQSIVHLAFNMIALRGFFDAMQQYKRMSPEEALFFYSSSAVVASLVSQIASRSVPFLANASSLGASGAVWAVLAAMAMIMPHLKASIIFIPGVTVPIGTLVPGLMCLDAAGLVLRWRTFDHAAHLGGALAGFAYFMFGFDAWTRTQVWLFQQRLKQQNNKS